MRPKVVKRFEYKGKIVKIEDHGEKDGQMRYWYALEFGFADLGGNTIDEAIQTAKRDIDNVEGTF